MIITIIISITVLLIVIAICYTNYKLYNYKIIENEVSDIKYDLKSIKASLEYYNILLDKAQKNFSEINTILKLRK